MDTSDKLIWPAACNSSFSKETWPEATSTVIHPAIGSRVRQSRILRERVPETILRLKRIAELNTLDVLTFSGVSMSFPPVGLCYVCGRGDIPFSGDVDSEPGEYLNHVRNNSVRTCGLCLMEVHMYCANDMAEWLGHCIDSTCPESQEVLDLLPEKPPHFPDWLIPRDTEANPQASEIYCTFCQAWYDLNFGGSMAES